MPPEDQASAMAAAWRSESPLRPDIVFLNPGTLGGALRSASRAADQSRRRWLRGGAGAALDIRGADGYQHMRRSTDAVRQALADWLARPPRQVALTGNATDGLHQALLSVDWRPGDHVLTSSEEHEALLNALARLEALRGVVVDVVPFPAADDDGDVGEAVARRLERRTRMVCLSHVSCRTGTTLDVAAVARAVAGHGAWLLIDGAHGAGTRLPVVHDGVDFYAFPGHKWLFGPIGTGALVVSARALAQTAPLLRGAPSLDAAGRELTGLDGAWRYESGTRDWSAFAGLGAALAFRRRWPEAVILCHYDNLSAAFVAGLGGRWPVSGRGPLLTLRMPEGEAWVLARRMWRRHRTIVKPTQDGIRITLGPWLAPEEAQLAAERLDRAAASGSSRRDLPTTARRRP